MVLFFMGKKREEDPREKDLFSFDEIAREHDRVYLDTCATVGYRPFFRPPSTSDQEKGSIEAISKTIHKGYALHMIPEVVAEVLNEEAHIGHILRGSGGDLAWKNVRDLVQLMRERGLVDYSFSNGGAYVSSPGIISSFYEKLGGADVPLFNAGYFSAERKMQAAVITNDTALIKTWQDVMKSDRDEMSPDRYAMFLRRELDGCQKIGVNTRF